MIKSIERQRSPQHHRNVPDLCAVLCLPTSECLFGDATVAVCDLWRHGQTPV